MQPARGLALIGALAEVGALAPNIAVGEAQLLAAEVRDFDLPLGSFRVEPAHAGRSGNPRRGQVVLGRHRQ